MNVIEANRERTVGICDDLKNTDENFIGEFNPVILLEWAQRIAEEYKGHDVIFMYSHRHPKVDYPAWMLAASDEKNGEIAVCVSGTTPDIDKAGNKP